MIDGHAISILLDESPQGGCALSHDPSCREKGYRLELNRDVVFNANPVSEHIELQRAHHAHDATGARVGSKNPCNALLGQLVECAI